MKRIYLVIAATLFFALAHSGTRAAVAAQAPHNPPTTTIVGEIPRDATALCADGTWSSSKKRSGACSSHGGIKTWFGKPPKGAVARCKDGTYTKSAGQGACSSHGGVAYPLQEPKPQD